MVKDARYSKYTPDSKFRLCLNSNIFMKVEFHHQENALLSFLGILAYLMLIQYVNTAVIIKLLSRANMAVCFSEICMNDVHPYGWLLPEWDLTHWLLGDLHGILDK